MEEHLKFLLGSDNRQDIVFVLSILRTYEGQTFLHDLCKDIVDKFDLEDELVQEVEVVLRAAGVMTGDFGIVEAHIRKRSEIGPWLEDPRPKVHAFARQYIHDIEQTIKREQQEAEEYIASRRLEYGEDL